MIILVDIGGTNTRITSTTDKQKFVTPIKVATPQNFDDAVATLSEQIGKISLNEKIDEIIIAMPGNIDPTNNILTGSPNLPDWENQTFEMLEKKFNTSLRIFNDADLAGLGEAVFGAGKNNNIVAYLTISTGIGSGRIVNQQIDTFAHGLEAGHQIIDPTGTLCTDCPTPTTLENLIGGASIERRFGKKPQEIDDPTLWDELAQYLAWGLNNIIVMWSPNIIVLGGPMMNDIKVSKVEEYLTSSTTTNRPATRLVSATLADNKAFHGAIAYLNQ